MRSFRPIFLTALCVGFGVVAFLASGCTSTPADAKTRVKGSEQGEMAQLHDGQTTREDVLLLLGVPTAVFEDGRVLNYRVTSDWHGHNYISPRLRRDSRTFLGPDYSGIDYSLTVVFDDHGRLVRHNAVTISSAAVRSEAEASTSEEGGGE